MSPWPRPLQNGDRGQLAAASSALAAQATARLEAGMAELAVTDAAARLAQLLQTITPR
jgi:hypothetical protein